MKKRRTSYYGSKVLDSQLDRICFIEKLENKTKAIEFLANKYIEKWAEKNGIKKETLYESGEYEKGEKTLYEKKKQYIPPDLEEARLRAEKKKEMHQSIAESQGDILKKARKVMTRVGEIDMSQLDEE